MKQRRYGSLRGLIPGRVSINERPQIVSERRRFGDWEGDTLYGSRTRHCLLTHVERKSRYLIAGKLPDRRAINVANCHSEQFQCVPNTWRKTLTLDNGKEFAAFKLIEQASELRVFFADPYCAWQRGANENGK
jgi:IS30 family transposase